MSLTPPLSRQMISSTPETPTAPAEHHIERAVLHAVAYADIFDYPLTVAEIHRYLVGLQALPGSVEAYLEHGPAPVLTRCDGFVVLAGREEIVETRRKRAEVARRLWPRALVYGRAIANLPFVRMVAVTGALAVDNVEHGADIDYLIVTEPGRLWLCRGLVIALVRLGKRRGDVICPNYLISERALVLQERTLYTAHELAQMVPIAGLSIYEQMRRLNAWTNSFLPNAGGPPRHIQERRRRRPIRALTEAALRTPAGGWLERWEMQRKLRKFAGQSAESIETAFCADWCKGHFDGHGQRILRAFADRLRMLGEVSA